MFCGFFSPGFIALSQATLVLIGASIWLMFSLARLSSTFFMACSLFKGNPRSYATFLLRNKLTFCTLLRHVDGDGHQDYCGETAPDRHRLAFKQVARSIVRLRYV